MIVPEMDITGAVDAYLKQDQAQDDTLKARQNFMAASGKNPDYEAELQKLSKETGVPLETARTLPQEMKKQAWMNGVDWERLGQDYPITTSLLANRPEFVNVAWDDLEPIKNLESAKQRAMRLAEEQRASANIGRAGAWTSPLYSLGTGLSTLAKLPSDIAYWGTSMAARLAGQQAPSREGFEKALMFTPLGGMALAGKAAGLSKEWYEARERVAPDFLVTDPKTGETFFNPKAISFENAAQVIAREIPSMAAMVGLEYLTAGAATPAVGAQIASRLGKAGKIIKYALRPSAGLETARTIQGIHEDGIRLLVAKGMSEEEAAAKAAPGAALAGITSTLFGAPMEAKFLEDLFTRMATIKGGATLAAKGQAILKGVAAQGVKEGAQETVQGFGEDLSKWLTFNPDLSIREAGENAVANFFGGFAMGGLLGGATMAPSSIRKAQQQEFFKALADGARNSKTLKRMPEIYQDALHAMTKDGPIENLRIAPEAFVTYFQSQNMDPAEMAKKLGIPNFEEAQISGNDLLIPTAAYGAQLAGSEHHGELSRDLRIGEDGITAREAEAAAASVEQIKTMAQEVSEEAQAAPEFQQIKEDLKSRYIDSGETPAVAETYAMDMAKVFHTMAVRTGLTPKELYEQYAPRIMRGEAPIPEQVISEAFTPETFPEQGVQWWEKDDLWFQGAYGEKPQKVLYQTAFHGTPYRGIEKFSLGAVMSGEGVNAQGRGLYFASKKEIAEHYKKYLTEQRVQIKSEYTVDGEVINFSGLEPREHFVISELSRKPYEQVLKTKQDELELAKEYENQKLIDNISKTIETLKKYEGKKIVFKQSRYLPEGQEGQVYEVEIPEDHEFMLWDKPLSEQPETASKAIAKAKDMLEPVLDDYLERLNADWDELTGMDLYDFLERASKDDALVPNGPNVQAAMERGDDAMAASMWLLNEGVKGNQYLDALSRAKGEGSYNYVVFDENAVKIQKTYYQSQKDDFSFGSKAWNEYYRNKVGKNARAKGDLAERAAEGLRKAATKKGQTEFDAEREAQMRAEEEAFLSFDRAVERIAKPRGWFSRNADGTFVIGKTPSGDFSTFIHEPAHAYLEMFRDLSQREEASDRIKEDAQKILNFLGVKSWSDIGTPEHEKWARANEAYCREGKAPSQELRGVFERFRVWLSAVYRKVTELDIELDDDIRGVFDRMRATDEEIELAHAEIAGPRLFKSAEEAGMTEDDFKRYAREKDLEIETAKAEILGKLNQAAIREKTREWKEEESNVRRAVEAMLDAEQNFLTIRMLREGETDGGLPITLNREALVSQFGEERVKALQKQHPGIYRTEGGMDAESAAEILGYPSGEAMLRDIESTPKRGEAVKQETQRIMTERHGDIRYDGTLEDQAKQAVANEDRARNLHKEMAMLRRKAESAPQDGKIQALKDQIAALEAQAKEQGADTRFLETQANALLNKNEKLQQQIEAKSAKLQALKDQLRQTEEQRKAETQAEKTAAREALLSVPPLQTFREAARQIIEQKPIRDLDANAYLNGQRKFSRESFQNAAKGKYQESADAKQKELLNHFLYLESIKVKAESAKMAAYGRAGEKPSFQGMLGKAGQDYQDQWNALASRYEFAKVTNKTLDQRQALAAWAAARESEGIILDPALYSEIAKNWREISISELRAVHEGLKNIETVARRSLHVATEENAVLFDDAKQQMVQAAFKNLKSKPLPLSKEARTRTEKMVSAAKAINIGLIKMERTIDHLDGGDINGPWRRYIFEPICEAQVKEYELNRRVMDKLLEAMEMLPKEQRLAMADIFDIPGLGGKITKLEIIGMALNMGNESNKTKMLKGMGWADFEGQKAVGEALSHLTREDWHFVQNVWDTLETLWPEIADLQRRQTGIAPPRIERKPFAWTLKDGSTVQLSGGYYPVVYDPLKSQAGARQADTDIMNSEGGYNGPVTFKGHTIERVEFSAPLNLNFEQVLAGHINKVIKDLSHREAAQSVAKFFHQQEIVNAVAETMGPEYVESLMPWLKGTVNDAGVQADLKGIQRFMLKARSNLVVSTLGFRAGSVFIQITDFARSLTRVKPLELAGALATFAAHPFETTRMVREKSGEMRTRAENLDRDVRELFKRQLTHPLSGEHIQFKITKAGMKGLAIADTVTSVTTWLGAYNQALKEGAPEEQAIREADRTVRMTLMTGAPKDLVAFQREANWAHKFMTMYLGDATATYGIMNEQLRNIIGGKKVGSSIATMAMLAMIVPILGELLKNRGPGDDEDKAMWALKTGALSLPSSIPLFRDITAAASSGRDYKFSPMEGAINKGIKFGAATADIFDSDKDTEWDDYFLRAIDTAGTFTGIPGTSQFMTSARYLRDIEKGRREEPESGLEYTAGILFGPNPKGAK